MAAFQANNLLHGAAAMDDQPQEDGIEWLNFRFPHEAAEVRHLYSTDPEFRALCDEYGEALRVLRHWETSAVRGNDRVDEYRTLVGEIETELKALLHRSIPH